MVVTRKFPATYIESTLQEGKTVVFTKREREREREANVKLRHVRVSTVAVEKQQVLHILSVCLYSCLSYAACTAHAPYHLVICGLSGSYHTFQHCIINGTIFWKKKLLSKKLVFWFPLQLLCETFHVLRRIQQDTIKNVNWSSCKVPIILVKIKWHLNDLNRYSKNTPISISMEIGPVTAQLFHADGRTDRYDDANSGFSQFCKAIIYNPSLFGTSNLNLIFLNLGFVGPCIFIHSNESTN
jgi:hypothetical protein